MHQRLTAFEATTSTDRRLLAAARGNGQAGRTKFLTRTVSRRHDYEIDHLANLAARRDQYRTVDLARGC
jgi:hypothetical protein